jgi:RNA polymerase sigma-70 factor (ECF subfamily)
VNREADFEDLFRRTRTDLLRYLTRRARSPEEAADLLAETYLVAWRRLGVIPAGEEARLWLFGVARNLLKKGASRNRTAELLVERLAAELRAARQVGDAATEDRAHLARAALGQLGEVDREILMLTAWEGLAPGQIAAVVGMSANRVRVRLHRARAKLRRELRSVKPPPSHRPAVVSTRAR